MEGICRKRYSCLSFFFFLEMAIKQSHGIMQVITQIAVASGKWNTRVLDSLLKTR